MRAGIIGLLMTAALAGKGHTEPSAYHEFEGAQLTQGRVVWLANCEGCHGYGTAGAPVPMMPGDWRARLQKPRAVLYRHAIDGFFGPDDTMMPPRGGNEKLTDNDVRAAVDYMTALAHSYLQTEEQTQ